MLAAFGFIGVSIMLTGIFVGRKCFGSPMRRLLTAGFALLITLWWLHVQGAGIY